MVRSALAALVVLGLAAGIWWLWPGQVATTPSTLAQGTTTTEVAATSSTAGPSTTTESDHVVETVEEAEEILRELWFGWFEGIYNQDEERIREVVATEDQVQEGISVFGASFVAAPTPEGVRLDGTEILRADRDCLVTWGTLNVSTFRGPEAVSEFVSVLRRVGGEWLLSGTWRHRQDLWETDCESLLLP